MQTVPPHVRVTSVTPSAVVSGAGTPVTIRYTGTVGLRPRILIYRVRPGHPPQQVKELQRHLPRAGVSTWDGTLAAGRPAPPGTYVAGLLVTNRACTTARSPISPVARAAGRSRSSSPRSGGAMPASLTCNKASGVTAYLKRLVSSLAAYQVADVVSKFIAVILLPVYTRYVTPAGYGVVELLANGVILVSILVRFGIIESFLRFYFTDDDQDRRDALARRSILFLLLATTVVAIVLVLFAEPAIEARAGARISRPRRRCASPSSGCGRSPTWSWPTGCCASRSDCGCTLSHPRATPCS